MDSDRRTVKVFMITKSQQNRGSYMRLYPLGHELSALGFDVTLVCPHEFANFKKETEPQSPNFRVILLPRLGQKTNYLGIFIRAVMILIMLARSEFDVYHVCSPAFLDTWVASLMGRIRNVPTVVDIDDLWGYIGGGNRNLAEQVLEEVMIKSAIATATSVVTASQFLKDRYERYGRGEITVIGNGIETSTFDKIQRPKARENICKALSIEQSTRIILGQVLRNDFDKVAGAIKKLNESGFKSALLFVGGLPRYQTSQESIEFESRDGVYLLPRLERPRFLELIAGSDAILFYMEDTEWEKARFPIRLTEFLASGTPLISLTYGESRSVLEKSEYRNAEKLILQDSDESTLIAALQFCLRNAEAAVEIARIAREEVFNKMAWAVLASALAEIYTEQTGREPRLS